MFKMVTGGNGRTVYCGIVRSKDEMQFTLEGKEYDSEQKTEYARTLTLRYDYELSDERKNFHMGDVLCVTVMPSRNNPDQGTAEEIAGCGEVIIIQNDRGNEKYIILGRPKKIGWNQAKTRLTVSFLNLKDMGNKNLGYESKYHSSSGTQLTSYWLNVSYFNKNPNSKYKSNFNAEWFERTVTTEDIVVMVVSKKMTNYNGIWYENYNGARFNVIKRAAQQEERPTTGHEKRFAVSQKDYTSDGIPYSEGNYVQNYNELFSREESPYDHTMIPNTAMEKSYIPDVGMQQPISDNMQFADFSDMFGMR